MKITVFTSNQPRHVRLLQKLAAIADEVYAIQETTTLFPGRKADYYLKSPVMERYFSHVRPAEEKVFGPVSFLPKNVTSLPLFMGDINDLPVDVLKPALAADYFVVFGASYIKGELADLLIAKRAVNIHMGASPYYRGNSCNFWALHDGRADYVSGTIHLLTKGLDSGPILYHALPKPQAIDPFELGMRSVAVAQDSICHHIEHGTLYAGEAVPQDRAKELRYTKNVDFHDAVAEAYLAAMPSPSEIRAILAERDLSAFTRPFLG